MRGLRIPETRRARELRADAPSAEAKLWQCIRGRKLNGFKFVRQERVGPYYADFACRSEMLAVEIDGATHSTQAELSRDARRSAFIEDQGYRIIRITNAGVFDNLTGVLETILASLERRTAL